MDLTLFHYWNDGHNKYPPKYRLTCRVLNRYLTGYTRTNQKETMGLFRKSFEEKYLRKKRPEEIERDKLSDELHVLFYPHSNERQYFFDLGFPASAWKLSEVDEYFNWRPNY